MLARLRSASTQLRARLAETDISSRLAGPRERTSGMWRGLRLTRLPHASRLLRALRHVRRHRWPVLGLDAPRVSSLCVQQMGPRSLAPRCSNAAAVESLCEAPIEDERFNQAPAPRATTSRSSARDARFRRPQAQRATASPLALASSRSRRHRLRRAEYAHRNRADRARAGVDGWVGPRWLTRTGTIKSRGAPGQATREFAQFPRASRRGTLDRSGPRVRPFLSGS